MRVGVICDGDAEVQVLNTLLPRIGLPGTQFLNATYADMQPLAPVMQIVAAAKSRLDFMLARDVDRILVIIDREQATHCPGERALQLRAAFHGAGYVNVEVVVKDRKLENWLIADAEGVNTLNGFDLPQNIIRQVTNAGADSLGDAQRELERAASKGYSKRRDAIRIAGVVNVALVEARSRSFRRFLRVAGDARYRDQSRRVAA